MRGYFTRINIGIIIIFLLPLVSASYITIQTSANINNTAGNINVTNNGDESAYKVQIISKILDQTYKSEIQDELKIGRTFTQQLPINLTNQRVGTYPLLTTIHYQDANGYLFSALFSTLVQNDAPSRSEVMLELNDSEIKDSIKVKASVKNLGEESKDVHLFLFISDEFNVKDNNRTVTVDPKSSKDVFFEVINFAARAKSTYTFYAVAEYDSQDGHYSVMDSGGLKVLEKKNKIFDTKSIIIALAIIALILIILQFRRKKK